MKSSEYLYKSFPGAFGTFLYTFLVALLMFDGKAVFGGAPSFLEPLFILLLFIISASLTGLMVLGRPVQYYFDGHKKEAFVLLFATLSWLVLFTLIVAVVLLVR